MKRSVFISIFISLCFCINLFPQSKAADNFSDTPLPLTDYRLNPLTNDDIIRMVKAGFTESVIINAIDSSENSFDLSIDGLFKLKNAGVSQKIIEAMQNTTGKNDTNSNTSGTSAANDDTSPELPDQEIVLGDVYCIDGAKTEQMKRTLYKVDGSLDKKTFIPLAGTFLGGSKTYLMFDRNHAQLRTINTSPRFQVTIPTDVNPSDMINLVKLKPKSDKRRIQYSKAKITKVSFGFDEDDIIPISIQAIDNKIVSGQKQTTYVVKLVSPIKSGEYAIVVGSSYYDFGVDKS